MADGKNQTRAMRIPEVVNDFRTIQTHIDQQTTNPAAKPLDPATSVLPAYALMRQCRSRIPSGVRYPFDPASLNPGTIDAIEAQKASLQRIMLGASSRRFQAHRIYLRVGAAMRAMQSRAQVLQGQRPGSQNVAALQAMDQRLRTEIEAITDSYVMNALRSADQRKGYWLEEDPSLEKILAWIRTSQ